MIRKKEIDFQYEQEKDEIINEGVSEHELEERMKDIKAKKSIEEEQNLKTKDEESKQKESELRQKVEASFCEEKKRLQGRGAQLKRTDLLEAMGKCKDDPTVQAVGNQMIQRIDNTLEEEMLALDKEKDEAIEKAKIQMIAENEKELAEIQANLDVRMKEEEKKMEDQLGKRREQILGLKRQNLEERLKVVAGDMSELQIKELRAQFDREYDQLDKTIREEKEKQLNNMRQALLQRRIAKEKKRKQEEHEKQNS